MTVDAPEVTTAPEAVAPEQPAAIPAPGTEEAAADERTPAGRLAIAVLLPAIGAGIMAGGVFNGYVEPRFYAVLAAALGVGLAYVLRELRPFFLSFAAIALGLFAIGLIPVVIFGGFAPLGNLSHEVGHAWQQARLLRPPIDLTSGFAALLGWIMAGTGFCAAWSAIVVRSQQAGMLLPLGVASIAAISVPHDQQVISGIIVVVLLGAGLAVMSGGREAMGADLPLGFELRRAARGFGQLAAIAVILFIAVQSGFLSFLFPPQLINPAEQAQKPHTAPLDQATDKVLFEVKSSVTGPWMLGALDVYDGSEWLLPPYAQSQQEDIPRTGIVDTHLQPGLTATFTMRQIGGAVLPTMANTTAIQAFGPQLKYDARSGVIRLVEGDNAAGFSYEIAAEGYPSVQDLSGDNGDPGPMNAFERMPSGPPPAVVAMISQAPQTSKWAEFDYLRNQVLANVTSNGAGEPVPIPPSRVQQILGSTKEASPYEIVAIQAMIARWIGLPSRIGYGFDGGIKVGDHLEVHPSNGAAFPEVYFAKHGWVPVIGVPQHTKVNETSNPKFQQFVSGVLPSSDISVPLFLPVQTPPQSTLLQNIQLAVATVVVVALIIGAIYLLLPILQKAWIRQRRRSAALDAGPRARIVQAYCEWRDALTDFGYEFRADTPIMLLRRFAQDAEHTQLAWLVTRALWGDLQGGLTDAHAIDAEEYSRVLRSRLSLAHPLSVRAVALVSRLSLRRPYEREVPTRFSGNSSAFERKTA